MQQVGQHGTYDYPCGCTGPICFHSYATVGLRSSLLTCTQTYPRHVVATTLCFAALGGIATAFIATLGPRTGLRTMVIVRYSSGYLGGVFYSVLNIITQYVLIFVTGSSLVDTRPSDSASLRQPLSLVAKRSPRSMQTHCPWLSALSSSVSAVSFPVLWATIWSTYMSVTHGCSHYSSCAVSMDSVEKLAMTSTLKRHQRTLEEH